MATTQSEDPNERVDHPRHYNAHASGIECIELIEHLPANLANAVKYIWRCGLKQSETPLRDLKSALWYTNREIDRVRIYDLQGRESKTDVVWRALARKVIDVERHEIGSMNFSTIEWCLRALLEEDLELMREKLEIAIGKFKFNAY